MILNDHVRLNAFRYPCRLQKKLFQYECVAAATLTLCSLGVQSASDLQVIIEDVVFVVDFDDILHQLLHTRLDSSSLPAVLTHVAL